MTYQTFGYDTYYNQVASIADYGYSANLLRTKAMTYENDAVEEYELDINFKDPADNRNLLNYFNYQIEKMDAVHKNNPITEKLRNNRKAVLILGAKTSEGRAKEKQKN